MQQSPWHSFFQAALVYCRLRPRKSPQETASSDSPKSMSQQGLQELSEAKWRGALTPSSGIVRMWQALRRKRRGAKSRCGPPREPPPAPPRPK